MQLNEQPHSALREQLHGLCAQGKFDAARGALAQFELVNKEAAETLRVEFAAQYSLG